MDSVLEMSTPPIEINQGRVAIVIISYYKPSKVQTNLYNARKREEGKTTSLVSSPNNPSPWMKRRNKMYKLGFNSFFHIPFLYVLFHKL
jgi:hypothetical protein